MTALNLHLAPIQQGLLCHELAQLSEKYGMNGNTISQDCLKIYKQKSAAMTDDELQKFSD